MGTFLCFAKRTQGDPAVCDPFASLRGNLGCSCAGCAVELTARLRRSVQTTTASQLTKRVCPAAHPPPRALRASGASRRVGANNRVAFLLGTFLCFAKETYPKGDPAVCDPFASLRGNLGCSCAGCAVELTARLRRSVQTTTASQLTKRVCPAAHPPPRALRASGASRRGGEQTTGSPFFWVRFFASPNVPKKATPVYDPFASLRGNLGCSCAGAPWNSLRACGTPFKQPRRVS